ncbi:MAG: hypothetical protein GY801_10600 [bacterium]|nr:hypothetical protein [bacterium]
MQKNTWFAKFLRTLGAFFPISPQRRGHCLNCGACCRLPNRCGFLKEGDDGKQFCAVYRFRPPNCRKYPRVEREWIVREHCGFYFAPSPCTEKEPDNITISSQDSIKS